MFGVKNCFLTIAECPISIRSIHKINEEIP